MLVARMKCVKCGEIDTARRIWLCKCPGGRKCLGCGKDFTKKTAASHATSCEGINPPTPATVPPVSPAPASLPSPKKKSKQSKPPPPAADPIPTPAPAQQRKKRRIDKTAEHPAKPAEAKPAVEEEDTVLSFTFNVDDSDDEESKGTKGTKGKGKAVAKGGADVGIRCEGGQEMEDEEEEEDQEAPPQLFDIIDLDEVRERFLKLKTKHDKLTSVFDKESSDMSAKMKVCVCVCLVTNRGWGLACTGLYAPIRGKNQVEDNNQSRK